MACQYLPETTQPDPGEKDIGHKIEKGKGNQNSAAKTKLRVTGREANPSRGSGIGPIELPCCGEKMMLMER